MWIVLLFIILMPLQTLCMSLDFAATDFAATFYEVVFKLAIILVVLYFECNEISKQREEIAGLLQ